MAAALVVLASALPAAAAQCTAHGYAVSDGGGACLPALRGGAVAQVLHRCVVRTGAIVAANAVVLNDTEVPAGALAVGTPAVVKEGRARREDIEMGAAEYVRRSAQYRRELRRID